MTTLSDALDGARLVQTADIDGTYTTYLGVWHGGHTVNFYSVAPHDTQTIAVEPSDTASIGDFETGEVTREEAEEAIERRFEEMEP